jgi:ferritin-like metal-binding protein YciE
MAYDQTSASGSLMASDQSKQDYIMGIQSAHALEKQATQLINRQLERIENYPEVAAVLRQHGAETEAQIQRLDGILQELGSSPSMVKDLATSMSGNMAAIAHSVMSDEIMKNHFANVAFEAFEQATYHSLIAMAQATGHQHHVPIYEATLREEEKTFSTLLGMTEALTVKYMELNAAGEQSKR